MTLVLQQVVQPMYYEDELAQVSTRSGRLLWPPGGAIIEQCEKGAMSSLTFHGNAFMIRGILFQKCVLQKSTC